MTHLAVELEETLPRPLRSIQRSHRQQLDGKRLALFDRDGHFLANSRLGKEVSRRDNTKTV